jgi:hypothetical protein
MKHAILAGAAIASLVGGIARADWNPGDPHKMHYPQLPDLTTSGINVNASWTQPFQPGFPFSKILADDFRCSETGPINDVHIWGSWLNDQMYPGARFKLSIHSDVPAISGIPNSYSRPGAELWSHIFEPTTYVARPYASGVPERFWDPNTNQVLGQDSVIWQYNFTHIPNPFYQEEGKIYWLDVQVFTPTPSTVFGWKTTNPQVTPHFMDDAVYGDTIEFGGPPVPQFPDPNNPTGGPTPWNELRYPIGPFEFQSMDLAFVITPEPASAAGLLVLGVLLRRRR